MSELSFRADRLNELMKRRKLNAGQLAYKTNISRTMIYYLQKGERSKTSGENVSKLAEALGTSMQYLVGETDDDSPTQKKMSSQVAEIVLTAEQLSLSQQRQLAAVAKALLASSSMDKADLILEKIKELGGEEMLNRVLDSLEEDSSSDEGGDDGGKDDSSGASSLDAPSS